MTASAPATEYRCPGEEYSITHSVHLARLAAFYPKCRDCPQRGDAIPFVVQNLEQVEKLDQRVERATLFTAEGVRGIYLNELTRSKAGEIAGAFASRLWDDMPRQAHGTTGGGTSNPRPGPTVVVGHDERPSSPDIVTGVGLALRHMGCQVIDIGLVTRPCFWFAVDHLQAVAGVHVCGAGCDPAWTGLDFVTRGAVPASQGGELDQIESRYREGYGRPSRRPGTQRTYQSAAAYEASLWKHFHALRPLRIALACSNRPVRSVIVRLFKKLACQLSIVETPTRLRNTFDDRDVDCLRTSAAVRQQNAHLGVLIDDDGQRCAFFTDAGDLVRPRDLTRVLADIARLESTGRTVVLESSTASLPFASGEGVVIAEPTSGTVATAMRAHAAVFAGGDSGRYWFQESFPTCDAILTIAKVLQALSRSDAPFSQVVMGN